jgi:hypothetical protein
VVKKWTSLFGLALDSGLLALDCTIPAKGYEAQAMICAHYG